MNVLAIDQGTSSTKAFVVGADGSVLASAEQPVTTASIGDGGVEQDPEELWQSVITVGRKAAAEAGDDIGAVGLANQGETVLAWDESSGEPLSVAISWQDRRAQGICERLADQAEELREITGLVLDPYFSAPKMRWLRENVTDAGVVTNTDTWLLYRLTGAFVTDAATASRTLLMDLDALTWSERARDLFGIAAELLPEIVGCAEVIGETDVFGSAVPVSGAIVDQQAALFAQRCFMAGEAKCTYGTGAFLLANVGRKPRRSSAGVVASVAWKLGAQTTYCFDGQVYTVGAAVGWLQRIGVIGAADDLDRIGGSVQSSGPVVFVPALAGLGAPFWRPGAKGAFTGLTTATGRGELIRAVVDGIAAQVAFLGNAFVRDLGRPLQRLRVDGGLTRSSLLMQTQADFLQAPVEVYASPDATAFGVAALARLGVADAPTPENAIARSSPSRTYEPQISADESNERIARWLQAVEMVASGEDR